MDESVSFEKFYTLWKHLTVIELYERTMKLFKDFTKMDPPQTTKDYTDRDYLEVAIELVTVIHCLVYGVDYETFDENVEEFRKIKTKNKLLWHLLKLKADLFGAEILTENGLELAGKIGENYAVIDKNNYS